MPDLKTLTTIVSLIIGVAGFLFGLFRDRWSRRESRLEAVGTIIQPLVQAAQHLMRANTARRKAEQLKASYPETPTSILEGVEKQSKFPPRTREVVERVNALVETYGEHINSSEECFRNAESAFAAKQLRLPVNVAQQLRDLKLVTSEYGRLVNEGLFDRADLEQAKFLDEYKKILKTARGWRLAVSQKSLTKLFRRDKKEEPTPSEFDLSQEEMDEVLELVQKRMTTQAGNAFAVHPPQKIIDNPAILQADDVIDQLKDSVFSLVFQDGTAKMLSLPELVAFNFNLITIALEQRELDKMFSATPPRGPTQVNVNVTLSMNDIMTPEMVKTLLSKFEFSDTPSDA